MYLPRKEKNGVLISNKKKGDLVKRGGKPHKEGGK